MSKKKERDLLGALKATIAGSLSATEWVKRLQALPGSAGKWISLR